MSDNSKLGADIKNSDMPDIDVETLISAWLDGRLDAEGSRSLQKALRDTAAARAMFRKYTQLDVALYEIADTSGMLNPAKLFAKAAEPNTTEGLTSRTDGSPNLHVADVGRGQIQQVSLQPRRFGDRISTSLSRLASWYTAIAVGMLLTVSLIGYLRTNEWQVGPIASFRSADELEAVESSDLEISELRRPPAPVATLSLAKGALWEKTQLGVGEALYEGDSIRLQHGEARISVGFGAELVVIAPCRLTFLSSDRIKLHEGKVAVDVAPWATGFTVITEEMDIVDLGTTFTVSAIPGRKSETTVLKGVVRVHPSTVKNVRQRGLLISEGQRVSIDGEGTFENAAEENVQQLLGSLDFGAAGPYRPVDLNNSGLGLSVGDEDLHWRVIAGPEVDVGGPQFASVCVPERGYLPNRPDTSQWISIEDWQVAAPNSVYTFQTVFDLEGYDLTTMQLFGRFLADNGIEAVRVNSKPVQVQSWVDNVKYQQFADSQFRFVNVTEGLINGRNVIEVDVRNGMMRTGKLKDPPLSAIPNPMALRVEWYAFGRQSEYVKNDNNANLFRQFHQQISPSLALSYRGPEI